MHRILLVMHRVLFLNKEKVIKILSRLAAKAKARDKNILKIILFGSLVNNTYTALSDADLIIILKESNQRFIDRIPDFLQIFLDAPVPVDVFPYTEKEARRIKLAKDAISKGIILA